MSDVVSPIGFTLPLSTAIVDVIVTLLAGARNFS